MLRSTVACVLAVLIAAIQVAQVRPERADDPDLAALLGDPGARYVHQQWTVEDGLPVNALTGIVQTADGWLWIGSFDGLLRYDGVRFTRFDTVAAPALRSNRAVQLMADPNGGLWILSEQGHLTHYASGRFRAVDRRSRRSSLSLASARPGPAPSARPWSWCR